jgi:putative ABC transport system permease protein
MSLWTRAKNVFSGRRMSDEINEELAAHIAEAVEQGRDPAEARRAFGSRVRLEERSRDVKMLTWLDSVRADFVFGWRQLKKKKITSAAAIFSLALAIGACTSAFRLMDALLFRPLPVAGAERLYSVAFAGPSAVDGKMLTYDSCSYPMFQRMRAEIHGQAEAVAISYNDFVDLTYGSDLEMEKTELQYVSGWMFSTFGLRPAIGRLLTEDDDAKPGAQPYAVLSYDYWSRRFARDPKVIGRSFRLGNNLFEIVGVADAPFTGTETGWVTDVFVPMAMKNPRTLASLNNFWLRTLVQVKPGVAADPVREKLRATFRSIQEERFKGFPAQSKSDRERFFAEVLLLEPAPAGRSNIQRDYGQALGALALLVALVLLIACANIANLMTAQAAARSREMALRVSIGAGRGRLVQLVLIESAWLALLATALGALFAWWSAPAIVTMINPPAYPARLVLPADWRVFGFGAALGCAVTFLFGLVPALNASSVKPVSALRGGENPHSRHRLMHVLIAAQVAFCFVVHLTAGLFVATFERLTNQPLGFSAERILNLEAVTQRPESPVLWEQVAEHLRAVPGVEKVALTGWPTMSGEAAVGNIAIDNGPPSDVFSDFVSISPGWTDTMRIPILAGRDFRAIDSTPAVAIVNQAFARQYFGGQNPVGRWFGRVDPAGGGTHTQIVGLVPDARSRDRLRWPIRPTVYIPLQSTDAAGALRPTARGTFVVRTSGRNPLALASLLRREVPGARAGFRVSNVRTQTEIIQSASVRERLLATLAMFFASVALLLAGIGLYGVLDYTVLQRRREIGIRMALGARALHVARGVTVEVLTMVIIGAGAGLALGLASARYVASLLYQVKPTDAHVLTLPILTILIAALVAALPAVIRAVRIDPAITLRTE